MGKPMEILVNRGDIQEIKFVTYPIANAKLIHTHGSAISDFYLSVCWEAAAT